MGRTTPTLRMGVEEEIARLRMIFRSIEDPELRDSMLNLLERSKALVNAFQRTPAPDPIEVVVFSMIAEIYMELKRCRCRCG